MKNGETIRLYKDTANTYSNITVISSEKGLYSISHGGNSTKGTNFNYIQEKNTEELLRIMPNQYSKGFDIGNVKKIIKLMLSKTPIPVLNLLDSSGWMFNEIIKESINEWMSKQPF